MFRPRIATLAAGVAVAATLVAGCATSTGQTGVSTQPGESPAATQSKTLTVLTHESFVLPEETLAEFEAATGLEVTKVESGDAGTLVNQLILTKDAPLGDVVFGIDNTFAARAIEAGVLAPYASAALPASAEPYTADASGVLTPIDFGDVCLNADLEWFSAHDLAVPQTLDDLTKPEYSGLLVVQNPASSSPGLAFLVATVAAKGDPGYLDYWKALKVNGVKVVPGWTEAYTVEFSGSSGKGTYPLVLSYGTSPASEIDQQTGQPRTASLTSTCLRQVEYAGVVAGAQNEVGARMFIDWLLSDEVQALFPENMWMYPVNSQIALPPDWAEHAQPAAAPLSVPASEIAARRDTWIKDWTAAVIG